MSPQQDATWCDSYRAYLSRGLAWGCLQAAKPFIASPTSIAAALIATLEVYNSPNHAASDSISRSSSKAPRRRLALPELYLIPTQAMSFSTLQTCRFRLACPAVRIEASSTLYPSLLGISQVTRRRYWNHRCSKPRSSSSVRRVGALYPELLRYRCKVPEDAELDGFIAVRRGYVAQLPHKHPGNGRGERNDNKSKEFESDMEDRIKSEGPGPKNVNRRSYKEDHDIDAENERNIHREREEMVAAWAKLKKEMTEDSKQIGKELKEIWQMIQKQPYEYLFGASERRGLWNPWAQKNSKFSEKDDVPTPPKAANETQPKQSNQRPSEAKPVQTNDKSSTHAASRNSPSDPSRGVWTSSEIQWVISEQPLKEIDEYYIDPITLRKVRRLSPANPIILPEPEKPKPKTKPEPSPKVEDAIRIPVKKFSPKMTDLGKEEVIALVKPKPSEPKRAESAPQSWLTRNGFTADIQDKINGPLSQKTSSVIPDSTSARQAAKPLQYNENDIRTDDVDLLRASDIRAAAGRVKALNPISTNLEAQERRTKLDEAFDKPADDMFDEVVDVPQAQRNTGTEPIVTGSTGEFYSDNDLSSTVEPERPADAIPSDVSESTPTFTTDGVASLCSAKEESPPTATMSPPSSSENPSAIPVDDTPRINHPPTPIANANLIDASTTLDAIEKSRALNQKLYVALAIDSDIDRVVVARASSSLHGPSSPLRSPASILTHLDKPYKYFEFMERLEALDYELIGGSRRMLVYKKTTANEQYEAVAATSAPLKQIKEAQETPKPNSAQRINLHISTSSSRMMVRRTESLFSGAGRVRARQQRHRSQPELERSPIRRPPKPTIPKSVQQNKPWTLRKKLTTMIAAGTVTASGVYAIGLLLEYFELIDI